MISAPVVRDDTSAGFTLMEIMVAMALLAIVFVAVYGLFSQTIRTEETTRFYTVAPMLAQKKMVEAVIDLSSSRYHSSGEFEYYPGFGWQTAITDVFSEFSDPDMGDMKQIDVTVTGLEGKLRFQLRRYELPI